MLVGDVALVADVVLELRPGVLEHGADLHLRDPAAQTRVAGLALAGRVERDQQVPAGVAEAALARGLVAHVAVVVTTTWSPSRSATARDVAVDVGDHADADLVGDLAQRVGVDRHPVDRPAGLVGERLRRTWCAR